MLKRARKKRAKKKEEKKKLKRVVLREQPEEPLDGLMGQKLYTSFFLFSRQNLCHYVLFSAERFSWVENFSRVWTFWKKVLSAIFFDSLFDQIVDFPLKNSVDLAKWSAGPCSKLELCPPFPTPLAWMTSGAEPGTRESWLPNTVKLRYTGP